MTNDHYCIVRMAAIVSMPSHRFCTRRFSFGPCWLLSRLTSVVLPAPFGPMIPSASPGATDRSILSATITDPKLLRRPLIFNMRLSLATRRANPNTIVGLRRARSARLALISTDRLHFTAGRNVGSSPVLGDHDVVLVAVLDPPLPADQRRLGDVFRREWRQVGSVP